MGKAIGIDLGTTNSVACYFDGHRSRILLNAQNEELTPSVAMRQRFDEHEEGDILVGRLAINQAKYSPEDAIFSVKRLIGRPYNHKDVQRLKDMVAYKVVESLEPVRGQAAVIMGGSHYLPEDISAFVLKEIKNYSTLALGSEVTHAVITVPAYFGEPQIAATRQAGIKAGFVVKTVLPEPTAAAIAFSDEIHLRGNRLLVFDLGGGTFDISIISVVDDNYHVLKEHGDEFLGGDDFDAEIVKMILKHVRDNYGVDLSGDPRFRIIAKGEAEVAKKSFSNLSTAFAAILIPEAARDGHKVINVKLRIPREEFERAISPYVVRCVKLVRQALEDVSLESDDITDVLLVGGATAMPVVYQSMEEVFGKEKIRRDVNPMHCVAIGAAILANKMRGVECPQCKKVCDESLQICDQCGASLAAASAAYEGSMRLQEQTVQHYGIEVVSGEEYARKFKILVEKGTPVPMNEPAVETFRTTEEAQSLIKIPVFQGLGKTIAQNNCIGIIEYELPKKLGLNHPVKLEFRMSRDREIKIAIEVDGVRQERSLKHEFIEEMSKSSEQSSELDDDDDFMTEKDRTLVMLRSYIDYAGEFVGDYDNLLTDEEKDAIRKAIQAATIVREKEDEEKAVSWIRKLSTLLGRCGTASLIAQAYAAADIAADDGIGVELREKAAELKRFAESRDRASMNKLKDSVASLVNRVHESSEEVSRLYAVKKYGGLLREG